MNFSVTLATFVSLVTSGFALSSTQADQFHASKDFIGNTMWLFGVDGVMVYSPDGKELKSKTESTRICGPKEEHTGPSWSYCRSQDVVSDGKKYVWAAIDRGKPTIDVFDINTGGLVGSFETCPNANRLEYHSLRDEIWVRCSGIDNDATASNLDVFSASNPSGEIQMDILTKERALEEGLSSRGNAIIDNSLGDIGYLTDNDLPSLFKVDLSQKTIIDKIDLTPSAHGLDEAAYSPVNKHIFLRSSVCCTCGFEGSDLGESCGRSDGYLVSPTTGSSAGAIDVNGVCGSSCAAKVGVDTIGVYEFDTVSNTVVGTHLMKEGFGGDPYPSPDGRFIVFYARNGGKTIRILEARENGFESRVLIDLELGFNMTGLEDKPVARDFAFVYKEGMTSVVFPSGTEHKVAIVEIPDGFVSNEDIKINYVVLNTDEFVRGRAPHGMFRRVEWAVGTDYVWVTDSTLDYIYIVDVVKQEVVNTLTDSDFSTLVSVQNFERARSIEMQKQIVKDMTPENDNSFEIAAIAIGCLALVVGLANVLYMTKMKDEFKNSSGKSEPLDLVIKKDADEASEMGGYSVN